MMTLEEFWTNYCPGETVESFAARCEDGDMRRLVAAYVEDLPQLYGIVCCLDWRHTFRGAVQYNRQEVIAGLMGYLELHSELWDKGAMPGAFPDSPSQCERRSVAHLVATELDQRKSFEATMLQFTEKDPAPSAALSLINVGVDMPEMKLPDDV
jgi:hypothetical protein